MAEKVFADGAETQGDYITKLGDALIFYQEWLGDADSEILDGPYAKPYMESYVLKQSVCSFLEKEEKQHLIEQLSTDYKEICLRYVRLRITSLDPMVLVREQLADVRQDYERIGASWQEELERRWLTDPASQVTVTDPDAGMGDFSGEGEEETMSDETSSVEEDGTGDLSGEGTTETVSLGQILDAYEVILQIQELDPTQEETGLMLELEKVRDAYLALTDGQKQLVWNADALIELLKQYDLWEEETPDDDMGFDDWGFDDGMSYTAEELKLMIEEKEQEIRDYSLDIREAELSVSIKRRTVEDKVVRSKLSGTVIAIGDKDGSTSEDGYFAKVANESGLYAKGSINELNLDKVHVGDVISGNTWDYSSSFTAVIKEISQYPDPNGSNMSYGNENTNSGYYPFYALIENTEGVEEGDVQIQFSEQGSSSENGIYLENFFVRTGNDGRAYVYIRDENQKLKKQYVTTGKKLSNYAIQITSGLTLDDCVAFPYGKGVKDGAPTKEVDNLQSAYMGGIG